MTRNETLTILRKISAYDGRTIGDGDVLAWHESIGHLDLHRVMHVIPQWFADPDNAGRRIMPGHIQGMCDRVRRGLAEREHTARVTGRDDLQAKIDADQRRLNTDRCHLCDEHGWINGHQIGDHDGQTREATIRCDHTDNELPLGFIPDPPNHGPRRTATGTGPIPRDGDPIIAAYYEHRAIDHDCPTCQQPAGIGCTNTLTGVDRIIPCTARLTTGYRANRERAHNHT